ncbi:hypothetical protein EVAR_93404_1 [Eumeta japonica]|uniref:Uncharacterized protein n=1 Tax=Eumeta variegata TaxID=151549 RepID=A0A4C1UQZ9_EUMVA|nr:hypothetical protein EVAR_93404_1 [Eumeta japonica]
MHDKLDTNLTQAIAFPIFVQTGLASLNWKLVVSSLCTSDELMPAEPLYDFFQFSKLLIGSLSVCFEADEHYHSTDRGEELVMIRGRFLGLVIMEWLLQPDRQLENWVSRFNYDPLSVECWRSMFFYNLHADIALN